MACNKPLYRIDLIKHPAPRRLPRDLDREHNGGIIFAEALLDDYRRYFPKEAITPIGCGVCFGCRMQESFNWAVRCHLEAESWEHNYFVTLTYSDATIPQGNFLNYAGEVVNTSLRMKDMQDWLKRLRKHFKQEYNHDNLRVFYSGEYGPLTDRAHYHAILFNCPELDLKFLRRKGSFDQFACDDISSTWCVPRTDISIGSHTIQDVSFDTCAYTARYVMKKQRGESVRQQKAFIREYNELHPDPADRELEPRENHFCNMSRRPGIARRYYDENKRDIYLPENDRILYTDRFQAFKSAPPRYFDRLYDLEAPDEMSVIKEQRRARGEDRESALLSQISEPIEAYRDRRENILARKEEKRCNEI